MRTLTASPPTVSPLRRALRFLRPSAGGITAILTLTLVATTLNAVEPLVLKRIFDSLSRGGANGVLWGLATLLGIAMLREGAVALSTWLTWRTRLRVQFSLTDATVSALHGLPISFHRGVTVGATMTRLDRNIQGFVEALNAIAFQTIPAVVYLAASAAFLFRLDARLALVVLLFAPLPAIIAALAAPSQIRREQSLLERWTRIYSRFNEVLSGIATVKSFAMEHRERRRFLSAVRHANRLVSRGVAQDTTVSALQNLVTAAAHVTTIAVGGALVLSGQVTIGTLVAVLGYLGGIFGPVQGLAGIYRTIQTAQISLRGVFELLDAEDAVPDAPGAVEAPPVRGEVRFEGVTFRFPGGPKLLDGVDLHVRPGEHVALVGPSGAGKTTLVALLQRFYDPSTGRITVDGRDLRNLKQRSLRRQIGVVLQDALLFNETIRDNIAYGRPGATPAQVEAAARAANAHGFISRLPSGYETTVGERGSRLSAGERQRIAIGRAILKDPAILILDEPTSALDAESEALVQEALERWTIGRTTFSIAHRLSTVVGADRILVLRDGAVTEQGTHEELLERDGYYARLVATQTRGLLHVPELAA